MALVLGRSVDVLWGGTAIEDVTSWSYSGAVGEIEQTSFDSSNFQDVAAGTISGSVSVDYYVDFAATEGFDEMLADHLARTSQAVLLSTGVSGETTLGGTGFVTSFDWSGDLDSTSSVSATIKISGTISQGTVA